MTDLFMKLLLPGFKPNFELEEMYQTDPEVYTQNLLDNIEVSKRSEMCAALLKTLAKYHTDKVQDLLKNIISDYYNNFKQQNQTNEENEIVIQKLIFHSLVSGFRRINGVVEINMSQELILFTYNNIVKSTLGTYFQAIESGSLSGEGCITTNMGITITVCLKYVMMFRNFLDYGEMLEILKYISMFLKLGD